MVNIPDLWHFKILCVWRTQKTSAPAAATLDGAYRPPGTAKYLIWQLRFPNKTKEGKNWCTFALKKGLVKQQLLTFLAILFKK